MTTFYLTCDTEYSSGLARRHGGDGRAENFARSIAGLTPSGPRGIVWQMGVLERHAMTGVFFVDPMPALIWGVEAIADVVGPIVARGHDVQLHLHSEWLELSGPANPLKGKTGVNIKDFGFDEQCLLIDYARTTLISAGAAAPVAFRAGNYGADDDTLRALAALGLRYDTSHCPGISRGAGALTLGPDNRHVQQHCGVIEVPIGCIAARSGGLRHFQLTALSNAELIGAVAHAAATGQEALTLVSHSFELLSRDRLRANLILQRRFERFCADFQRLANVRTGTYAQDPPQPGGPPVAPLPHRAMRTLWRNLEQGVSNALYGAK